VSGEGELTLNQAIDFSAYRDLQRARKAPVYIPERDFRPESLMAYWHPEVTAGVWSLWRALEDGHVTAIEYGRPVSRSRWSVDRLRQLAPDEPTALGPFIREIQRSPHVRILAAELIAFAKPAPATTADAPEPAPEDDNKSPPKPPASPKKPKVVGPQFAVPARRVWIQKTIKKHDLSIRGKFVASELVKLWKEEFSPPAGREDTFRKMLSTDIKRLREERER
jgi:hypothetical protein